MNLENPLLQGIAPTGGTPAAILLAETNPSGAAGSRLSSIPGFITQAAGSPTGATPTFPPLYIDNTTGVLYWHDGASWIAAEFGVRYVDTVADLTAVTTLVDGSFWQTSGYRAINDGGTNLYRYDLVSAALCDGVSVLDGIGGDNSPGDTAVSYPGTGTGRFIAVDTERFTTKQCGAFADGVNDDSFRVNAAVAGARSLYVDDGAYLLNSQILLSQNDRSLTFAPGAEWRSGLTATIDNNIGLLHVTGGNVVIENPQIDVLDNAHTGVRILGSNIRVRGGYVNNCGYNAFYLSENVVVHENISIEEVTCDGSNTAGDNPPVAFTTGAIWCGYPTGHVNITRCSLLNCLRGVNARSNVSVFECLIETDPASPSTAVGLYAAHDSFDITFSGNIIRNPAGEGIKVSRNAIGVLVSGNTLDGVGPAANGAIFLQGSSRVTVIGNIIKGGCLYGIHATNHTGPLSVSKVLIHGNNIEDHTGSGIQFADGTESIISNNIIIGTLGGPNGITFTGAADNCHLLNNIIHGANTGINTGTATRVIVIGNRLVNVTSDFQKGSNLYGGNESNLSDVPGSFEVIRLLAKSSSGTQIRGAYNSTNYWTADTGSSGTTTLNAVGTGGGLVGFRVLTPMTFQETVTPPTPISNRASVYAQDNGAGKTQLMVQFATGAPVQLAIEP